MLRAYFFDKWPQLRIYIILTYICCICREQADRSDDVVSHDSGETNENDTQHQEQDRQQRHNAGDQRCQRAAFFGDAQNISVIKLDCVVVCVVAER